MQKVYNNTQTKCFVFLFCCSFCCLFSFAFSFGLFRQKFHFGTNYNSTDLQFWGALRWWWEFPLLSAKVTQSMTCLNAGGVRLMKMLSEVRLFRSSKKQFNKLLWVFYPHHSNLWQWWVLVWFTISYELLVSQAFMPHPALGRLFSSCYLLSSNMSKSKIHIGSNLLNSNVIFQTPVWIFCC